MRRRRRKAVLLAAVCLSFFLGTAINLLGAPRVGHPRLPDEVTPGPGDAFWGDAPDSLRQQLRDRYRELIRYREPAAALVPGRGKERRLMDLEQREIRGPGTGTEPDTRRTDGVEGAPGLGCQDLNNGTDLHYLGSGYTKAVYRSVLNGNLSVAMKSVDFGGHDIQTCVRHYRTLEQCYRLASYKIVKEMILLQRLRHPNILQLYGYCYQDSNDISDTLTTITELGSPLEMIQLLQSPWEDRFRICLSLVRLLHYLAHSPLGSITLLDFRPRQFVIVDGELKVTDLDDASMEETPCVSHSECFLEFPARNFTLECSVEGRCQNINEKRNLYNAYRFFFTYLLPHSAPLSLRPFLDAIVNATGELRWGVDETLDQLEKVFYLYRYGLYLPNVTDNSTADYKEVAHYTVVDEDYKCWPSYHHNGCLLSVFDLNEAKDICRSHSQCQAFVWTNQTTWTGRQLVFFKTGLKSLAPDHEKLTYVKVSG
ncbi:hypothetical protein GDO86_008953 [Hymenochirus boettgeri]|uniref:Extracellular tyrosine-protein kinase PKDCC n=1 Tax=Hymenochirus boettgeri TaxID=247094 RepID=A0A8T2JLX3_9PIPI|nr:hypothetical protein GDO86_008953 [Hymenochirus boettgeri]